MYSRPGDKSRYKLFVGVDYTSTIGYTGRMMILVFFWSIGATVFLLIVLWGTRGERGNLDRMMPFACPVEAVFLAMALAWPLIWVILTIGQLASLIWHISGKVITMIQERETRIKRAVQWSRRVREGEQPPTGYARVYFDFETRDFVAWPIGLHWVVIFLRWVYYQILVAYRPGALEIMQQAHFEAGRASGLKEVRHMVDNAVEVAIKKVFEGEAQHGNSKRF